MINFSIAVKNLDLTAEEVTIMAVIAKHYKRHKDICDNENLVFLYNNLGLNAMMVVDNLFDDFCNTKDENINYLVNHFKEWINSYET